MSNPFQDQLLKAGLVTKEQVQKAQKESKKKNKQQRSKKHPVVDENKLKAQQAAAEKAKRDRELNNKKEAQAKQKALSAEINQLITQNLIPRDESCDLAYHFEHNNKIKNIYINADMRQKIANGQLGIARIEGRYELVPLAIAEKIQRRNDKRVILVKDAETSKDDNDPYADYQIPDDLIW